MYYVSKGRILRLILSQFMFHFSQHCDIFCLFCFSVLVKLVQRMWCLYLSLSGLMFSRLSSFKKLLLLACFERGCLWGCSLMSSYLTMDTSHEKLETNSAQNKDYSSTIRKTKTKRRTCSASSIFFVLLSRKRFMIQFQAMVGYQKSHFSIASFRLFFCSVWVPI